MRKIETPIDIRKTRTRKENGDICKRRKGNQRGKSTTPETTTTRNGAQRGTL